MTNSNHLLPHLKHSNALLLCWSIILTFMVCHAPLLFFPAVNLEFVFADLSSYFQSGHAALLNQYFEYEANTVGMSFSGWLIASVTDINTLTSIRLLSLSGVVLLGVAFLNLSKIMHRNDTAILLWLLLLNPLVWTYATRATADFFPMALAIYASSLLLKDNTSNLEIAMHGLLLGLAIVIKFHAILVFILVFGMALQSQNFGYTSNKLRLACKMLCTSVCVLMAYLFFSKFHFGFWLTPPKFQTLHGIKLETWANNVVLYCGFLFASTLGLSIMSMRNVNLRMLAWAGILLIGLLFYFGGYYLLSDTGEMGVGTTLTALIGPNRLNGIFAVVFFLLLLSFAYTRPLKFSNPPFRIFCFILIAIGLLSLSRPAQRYLIFIYPVFLFTLPALNHHRKKLAYIGCILFLIVDLYISYMQLGTGLSAKHMAQYIQQHHLENSTNADLIIPHVGDLLRQSAKANVQYKVIAGQSPSAIYVADTGLHYVRHFYSLVPNE